MVLKEQKGTKRNNSNLLFYCCAVHEGDVHIVADETTTPLIDKNLMFVVDGRSQDEVFQDVADRLLKADAVKPDFLKNLEEREKNYPTGMDMSVVNKDYPNIAIPHTEGQFVNTRKIIPVRLKQPIEFANMISPDQHFPVGFLFMILNNDPEGQANVLAQIMDFLTNADKDQLARLFNAEDTQTIFDILAPAFN
jgi:PTS system galactitol-specific IIA component